MANPYSKRNRAAEQKPLTPMDIRNQRTIQNTPERPKFVPDFDEDEEVTEANTTAEVEPEDEFVPAVPQPGKKKRVRATRKKKPYSFDDKTMAHIKKSRREYVKVPGTTTSIYLDKTWKEAIIAMANATGDNTAPGTILRWVLEMYEEDHPESTLAVLHQKALDEYWDSVEEEDDFD